MGCDQGQNTGECLFDYLSPRNKERRFWYVFHQKVCSEAFWLFWFHTIGGCGDILVLWSSSTFRGDVLEKKPFGITISFTSVHNNETWKLTNVYGPCIEPARTEFITWFRDQEIEDDDNWIFLGDFNFYRLLSNRNKPGGCLSDMFIFNDAIGHLGLVELPLKGRAFTWSNMQADPLLEQLDWFFTSPNWMIDYPNAEVLPMAKITSDHIPCKVAISTSMPRSNIFRFENYWVEQEDFLETVQNSWLTAPNMHTATRTISSKFKSLRSALKMWSKGISNLKLLIGNCNLVICFLDSLEDRRGLFNLEINLRAAVKRQLEAWLKCKNLY